MIKLVIAMKNEIFLEWLKVNGYKKAFYRLRRCHSLSQARRIILQDKELNKLKKQWEQEMKNG